MCQRCSSVSPKPQGNAAYAPCQSPNNTLAKLKAPLFRRALVSEVDSVTACANASFLGDSWAALGGFLWKWGLGLTTVSAGNFVKEGLRLYFQCFHLSCSLPAVENIGVGKSAGPDENCYAQLSL